MLNAKSISVLGKSNSKSRYQYWFRAMIITHLRLVRLGQDLASLNPSAKIKFRTGFQPTISSTHVCLPFLLCYRDCWNFVFCAVQIRLKEANFKRESEQIILHGRLAFTIAQYWFTLGVNLEVIDALLFKGRHSIVNINRYTVLYPTYSIRYYCWRTW